MVRDKKPFLPMISNVDRPVAEICERGRNFIIQLIPDRMQNVYEVEPKNSSWNGLSFVDLPVARIHEEGRKKLVHRVSDETQNSKWLEQR